MGFGTQTAMITCGGRNPPTTNLTATEEYDGSSWTTGGTLPQGTHKGQGAGTQTAGTIAGGVGAPYYPNYNYLSNKEYLRDMAVTGISVGKTGLENKLDADIIGKVGFQRYEVNAYGKRINQIDFEQLILNEKIKEKSILIILDQIKDPQNIGSIMI